MLRRFMSNFEAELVSDCSKIRDDLNKCDCRTAATNLFIR